MSKPVLLSGGNGKVSELAGTESRQVLTWSQTAEEWTPGPGVGGSGGGGELFYLNDSTAPEAPTTNIPTGASGETVKELGTVADGTGTTVLSTASIPVLPAAPELVIGFVTDLNVPGVTSIPAGLWEFNVWAETDGNTTNQSYLQAKVYKYDGTNAPTLIATSAEVYLYDPREVTQYTLSVLIPGGVTLLATDRIYVEILGGSTTSNQRITLSFGNSTPSHVHTTIFIPINLGTDVTGTLPVANGGTGATSLTGYVKGTGTSAFTASAAIPVADVTGAAPLASPTFTGTVTIPAGASISGFAPLASPTFTGTPAAPTASSGDNTTQIATTAFVTTAVAASVGAPYDLPFELPGTPVLSTKVVNFEAVRAFILASTGHQGGQFTNPSGNFVCTVRKNATTLGTITFATAGFSSSITATSTDRTFAAGDVLSVETPVAALGIDTPFATLLMNLV
jgi:hypothetical protein